MLKVIGVDLLVTCNLETQIDNIIKMISVNIWELLFMLLLLLLKTHKFHHRQHHHHHNHHHHYFYLIRSSHTSQKGKPEGQPKNFKDFISGIISNKQSWNLYTKLNTLPLRYQGKGSSAKFIMKSKLLGS